MFHFTRSISIQTLTPVYQRLFLDVSILKFDSQQRFRAVPLVRKALSIFIKAWHIDNWNPPVHVDLKGSRVVISFGNELFIADWQERSGVKLSPYLDLPPAEEQTEEVRSYSVSLPLIGTDQK